jgi:hypothetical protein
VPLPEGRGTASVAYTRVVPRSRRAAAAADNRRTKTTPMLPPPPPPPPLRGGAVTVTVTVAGAELAPLGSFARYVNVSVPLKLPFAVYVIPVAEGILWLKVPRFHSPPVSPPNR